MIDEFKFLHKAIFRAVLGCCSEDPRDARSVFGIEESVAGLIAALRPEHRHSLLAPAPPGVIEFRVPRGTLAQIVRGHGSVADAIGAGGLMSVDRLVKIRELNASCLTLMRDIMLHDAAMGCSVFRVSKDDASLIMNTPIRRLLELFRDVHASVFTVTGADSVALWTRIGATSPEFAAVLPVMFKNEKVACL